MICPTRPEEGEGQTDTDEYQASGEVDNKGDQLMLSVADNHTYNSSLPNSRKHQNPSWNQWRGPRDADN